jgi:hypothetical protein
MAFVIRHSYRIAAIPIAMIAVSAMAETISSVSRNSDPVAVAARQNAFVFIGYIIVLVLVAFFSWWLWHSGNKLQNAVNAAAEDRVTKAREDAKREAIRIENDGRERIARVEGESRERIAAVKAESDQKLSAANTRSEEMAAESKRRAAELEGQNLATEARLLDARRELEKEKLTRLELEKSLRPRELYSIQYTDGTHNFDNLRELKGVEFIVEAIPDFEARKAASEIMSILEDAGLKVTRTGITQEFVWDGVTIEQYLSPPKPEPDDNQMRSGTMEGILEEFLGDNDWVAMRGFAKRGDLKPNELRIRVGFKPSPYFAQTPEWAKEMENRARQAQHRRTNPIPKNKPIGAMWRGGGSFPREPK